MRKLIFHIFCKNNCLFRVHFSPNYHCDWFTESIASLCGSCIWQTQIPKEGNYPKLSESINLALTTLSFHGNIVIFYSIFLKGTSYFTEVSNDYTTSASMSKNFHFEFRINFPLHTLRFSTISLLHCTFYNTGIVEFLVLEIRGKRNVPFPLVSETGNLGFSLRFWLAKPLESAPFPIVSCLKIVSKRSLFLPWYRQLLIKYDIFQK